VKILNKINSILSPDKKGEIITASSRFPLKVPTKDAALCLIRIAKINPDAESFLVFEGINISDQDKTVRITTNVSPKRYADTHLKYKVENGIFIDLKPGKGFAY